MITTPPPFFPEISVIIPMYNTEKYIGACLESILNQTFQNFEVIVVDDCSTDNSCAVVESYIPKFSERLKLIKMKNNSGSPAAPSNKGLKFSRGKYIYFMDNDDLLLNTALQYFYELAENTNADVIHMDRRFGFVNSEEIFPSVVNVFPTHSGKIVNEPTVENGNIFERVTKLCSNCYARAAWHSFVCRDFLIENDIVMESLPWGVDTVWTFKVMFCAKRILHIPQPFYFWRKNKNSISHSERSFQENIKFHMCTAFNGTKQLCNFMNKQKFFIENREYCFLVMDYFFNNHIPFIQELNPNDFYEIVKIALKENFDDVEIMAYIFTLSNLFKFRSIVAQQKINELENKLKQLQGG